MRVFLSYASEDRGFAESLVEHLKTAGIDVSDPLSQLSPGDNWPLQIGQALERSDAMVVLVSPASARSETVKRDIEYALSSKRFSGRLIPVIVRPAPKAPWILNRLHPEKGNPTRVSKRILERLERVAASANQLVPKPRELFLSHANTDRNFVRKLAEVLQGRGVRYWYSEKHIVGAQQWHDEIGRALHRCDWFAVVLSPAAVASTWVKRELLYALDHSRYEGRIVPIVLKPCDSEKLSWTLDTFQRVDFFSGFDEGCHQLLRVWGIRREFSAVRDRRQGRHDGCAENPQSGRRR